jgi:adenosylcobinamide-GDP ribazoletransferase
VRLWPELIGAATLLTRLPVGGWVRTHAPATDCLWAYPVVGLVVGGLGALILWAGMVTGLSQPLSAAWAIAATVALTGGLHEDGLADTADGFGGGRTVERKLDIMRDSRIGSFGALALCFSLALRILPLASSPHPYWALIGASMLGRGAMLIPLLVLKPARTDGLAASLGKAGLPALVGLAIAVALSLLTPAECLAALAAGLVVSLLSYRQIGGYTGDVLGAVEQVAECAALSALSR